MCETSETENPWGDLRAMWAEADKKAKDYRDKGEVKLLEEMHDAWAGLKECGWKEIEYCPKDGTRFLAICAGSTGVFPHYYRGEWPDGHWWAEAHGDLWPSRPILWKPMPSNVEHNRRPAASSPGVRVDGPVGPQSKGDFRRQQAQEEVRWRNMMTTQIRNAIIEIEDGDIDDAVARLKTLIGEQDIGDEVTP